MPKKSDPLTVEEMQEAADIFFPLYSVIADMFPQSSMEDKLNIMENVAKLAHKRREEKLLKEKADQFGFNKEELPDA